MATFGEILAELRQDRNLTQKDLAKYLHVSPGTVSNYENNIHLPDLEKILILANYFGVTTDYLLGRTPFSISPDLFYKEIGNGMKISDLNYRNALLYLLLFSALNYCYLNGLSSS